MNLPRETPSLSVADRLELWMSTGRTIDGLWIGGITATAIRKVEEAVELIRQHDPRRYNRIRKDLSRIWVRLLPGHQANFNAAARACQLDERFVLNESTPAADISLAIVHEATHARIDSCGVAYVEDERLRIEMACRKQELAFAERVPLSPELQQELRHWIASPPSPEVWTDAAMERSITEGAVKVFQHLGVPVRLIPFLVWPRKPITAFRRLLRNARAA